MKQYLKMADVFKVGVSDAGIKVRQNYIVEGVDDSFKPMEYAAHAINSHDELVQMSHELLAAIEGLLDIVGESDGVSGYHLNGDIAEWGEFEELNAAYDAVNKANGGAA